MAPTVSDLASPIGSEPSLTRPLSELKGLGPKSALMLEQVGITHFLELQTLGAVQVYWRVKQFNPRASLNLLWALEGALSNRAWQEVARTSRFELLTALDDLQKRETR